MKIKAFMIITVFFISGCAAAQGVRKNTGSDNVTIARRQQEALRKEIIHLTEEKNKALQEAGEAKSETKNAASSERKYKEKAQLMGRVAFSLALVTLALIIMKRQECAV